MYICFGRGNGKELTSLLNGYRNLLTSDKKEVIIYHKGAKLVYTKKEAIVWFKTMLELKGVDISKLTR